MVKVSISADNPPQGMTVYSKCLKHVDVQFTKARNEASKDLSWEQRRDSSSARVLQPDLDNLIASSLLGTASPIISLRKFNTFRTSFTNHPSELLRRGYSFLLQTDTSQDFVYVSFPDRDIQSDQSVPNYRSPHHILIIGATGRIGTYVTRAIVDASSQGHFGRISIYTSEKTIIQKVQDICALESWGVEIFVGDLDDERRFKDACRGRWKRLKS